MKTDEWVIHSPTITSTKFWPGELGRFSNFAVLCAKVVVGDNNYGPQFFFVPIRDEKDHLALPGVEVGDIGAKMGYQSKDNGYLIFTHYRVPRENLVIFKKNKTYIALEVL